LLQCALAPELTLIDTIKVRNDYGAAGMINVESLNAKPSANWLPEWPDPAPSSPIPAKVDCSNHLDTGELAHGCNGAIRAVHLLSGWRLLFRRYQTFADLAFSNRRAEGGRDNDHAELAAGLVSRSSCCVIFPIATFDLLGLCESGKCVGDRHLTGFVALQSHLLQNLAATKTMAVANHLE
jgi:hypothetical protein